MAERWHLTGQVLVACNCDWGCPCNFNARPTKGKCEGGWTWHVVTGAYGDVALVVLPKKQVTSQLVAPSAGSKSWWSGTGDDYTATMSRSRASTSPCTSTGQARFTRVTVRP